MFLKTWHARLIYSFTIDLQSLDFFRFVFIGEQGIEVFWREANKRNICIALRQKVPSDANNETYENVSMLGGNPKLIFRII